jgi:hypothetical protein
MVSPMKQSIQQNAVHETTAYENAAQRPMALDEVELPHPLPPLVVMAFVRPDLLQKVLQGIQQQSLKPKRMIAFVDGARREGDRPLINQCIALLHQFSSCVPVDIIARPENLGCDQNVLRALTEVLSSHDSLIYLEDDTVPNPYFYDRMCRLLTAYRAYKQVCSISAYASIRAELEGKIETDFTVSSRVFCWGFGTWADRWNDMNLGNQPGQANPFGHFYQIPATAETKMTLVNQFWLEQHRKTDWVITFTLAALYHQKVHIIPTRSFIYNIGFGHPESKTYRGQEQAWVNARYDQDFYPNTLSSKLALPDVVSRPLKDTEFMQYLLKQTSLWLSPAAFFFLLRRIRSLPGMIMLIILFVSRFPQFLRHSVKAIKEK